MDFSDISKVCIPILASILGVALPIIVQTIGRIDERYNSTRLVNRFKKEGRYRFFLISLILSIAVALYNSFVYFPWKFDWGRLLNTIMSNSSDILLLLSTIILIVFLFLIVMLIIRYYDYQGLFKNIKKNLYKNSQIKKNLSKNESDIYDFIELAKFIVRKDDNDTLREVYQFLYDYTAWKVSKKDSGNGDFDNWLYDGIISLNDVICRENINPISIVNGNDIVKLLIPMDKPEYGISDKTYQVLWRVLQQQLFYDRTELVYKYWTFAYQFINTYLQPIVNVYDFDSDDLSVVNQDEVEKRNGQIDRFKEFHLTLCGMLLYYKKYELIKKIADFSQSKPYRFPLIPSSFQEIILWFKKLNLKNWEHPFYFEQFYWFQGEEGVNAGDISMGYTKRFLTLFLYRLNGHEVQYTVGGVKPWDSPFIPDKLKDTTNLLSIVEQMKFFVDEWMRPDNLKIIDSLGWIPLDKKVEPTVIIDEFIKVLSRAIKTQKLNIIRSDNKVMQFNNRSREIIDKAVTAYREVFKECDSVPEDLEKDIINASHSFPFDKEAFSDDQTISYANFDEVLAYRVASEFYHLCFNSVYKRARRSFTIDNKQLFDALDKLIGKKQNEYMVVAFGLYLDFYLDGPKKREDLIKVTKEESDGYTYKYNDIVIYDAPSGGQSASGQFAAIIKKDDLPCFVANEPPKATKKIYGFEEPIDEELKLYTSVLFEKFPEDIQLDVARNCLASIYFCPLLYWNKDTDVTLLKLLSRYTESGKGQDISTLPEL